MSRVDLPFSAPRDPWAGRPSRSGPRRRIPPPALPAAAILISSTGRSGVQAWRCRRGGNFGALASGPRGVFSGRVPGRFLEGGGVVELAAEPVDVLVSAIVGAAGLRPTLAGIGAARRMAWPTRKPWSWRGRW